MLAIFLPFLIGAKIRDRGLHLDHQNLRVRADRDEIGAPAGGERNFGDRGIIMSV